MIVLGEPPTFAAEESSVCVNCHRPIQQRKVLGWVHVEGFYICRVLQADDEPYKVAMPEQ